MKNNYQTPQYMDYIYPRGPIQFDPVQYALDQFKNKTLNLGDYTPQALAMINKSHIEPEKDKNRYGSQRDDTVKLDPKLIKSNPKLALEVLRHEYAHLLDKDANEYVKSNPNLGIASSKGLYNSFQDTGNDLQKAGLQKFYNREFPTRKMINLEEADIEGYAQTAAQGQSVLNNAPKDARKLYQAIYSPIVKNIIGQILSYRSKMGGIE